MEPVILMVCGENDTRIFDMEVMPDVLACDLADAIANALQWPGTYDLEVSGTGRRLTPHQCLADAEIWDGVKLRLVSSTRPGRRGIIPETERSPAQTPAVANPVANWKPMQNPDGKDAVPAPPPATPLVGWRQPGSVKEKKP